MNDDNRRPRLESNFAAAWPLAALVVVMALIWGGALWYLAR